MKTFWKTNVVISLLLLVMGYYYFSEMAGRIPNDQKMMVNIVLIPFVLGALGGILFRGGIFERVLYILPIPVIIVMLLGGDPAKPGVEYILIGPLLLFFVIGIAVGYTLIHQATRMLKRR